MRAGLLVGLWGFWAAAAGAQAPPASHASGPSRPTIRAARTAEPIHVDGRLEEAAWARAEPATEFTQLDPDEGKPSTQRTDVRVLVDASSVYIGAHLFERDPANVRPRLSRRDEPVDGDIFAVSIDSRHDHLSAYYFRVTAGGALRDAVVRSGERGDLDLSWDAVWDAKVQIDSTGWSVEIAIPLSQLPYTRTPEPVWGIQFERFRWNQQEQTFFAFTPKREQQGIQTFGHLVGLGPLPPPGRMELLPYVTSRAELHPLEAVTPLRSRRELVGGAGVDLKLRPASGYAITGTINPDFGQVEVDPAVVNLTQFETFFEERRPFFVEGRELFTFGRIRAFNAVGFPAVFFSRRIGRAPARDLTGDGFGAVRSPAQSTIAGALKITGKSRGWSTALLDAVTLEESARYLDPAGATHTARVEPLSNFLVGRIRREMGAGNTQVGGFFSLVNRDLADSALASQLAGSALVTGVDVNHAWSNRRWALDASVAVSRVAGATAAISSLQKSSRRYYQRPDAASFRLDPSRRSLGGYAAQLALSKLSGVHWTGNLAYQGVSPGFEANDLGFQTAADRHAVSTSLGYQQNRPGPLFRSYQVNGFTNHMVNADGNLVFAAYQASGFARFRNFSGLFTRFDYLPAVRDDRLTRGGPLATRPTNYGLSVNYFSDNRQRISGGLQLSRNWSSAGGYRNHLGLELNLQPTATFTINLQPSWARTHSVGQYVTSAADPVATATSGGRYVFATIEQRELAVETRVSWTFTPRLSAQLYLQPLISTVAYDGFKELRAPRTFTFDVYGIDRGTITRAGGQVVIDPDADPATANTIAFADPDFGYRSLRGNAVLRWEYRPGATLYVVWQQLRQGAEPVGDFDFARDWRGLFREPAENVLAVKASYWLSW